MGEAMPKKWLSVKEAADSLGVGRTAVYGLVAAGKLACYRMTARGRIRFRPADLDAFAEATRVGPRAKVPPVRRAPLPRPEFDHGF